MPSNLRITGALLKVLNDFLHRPEVSLFGNEIAGRTNLQSGTVYPLLNRLEEAGLLSSQWEDVRPQGVGRPRRRLYKMTELGKQAAKEAFRELEKRAEELAEQRDAAMIGQTERQAQFEKMADLADEVTAQRDDLQSLFDLQRIRMKEADQYWQQATGRHDTLPDLGELLDWLMERAKLRTGESDAGRR